MLAAANMYYCQGGITHWACGCWNNTPDPAEMVKGCTSPVCVCAYQKGWTKVPSSFQRTTDAVISTVVSWTWCYGCMCVSTALPFFCFSCLSSASFISSFIFMFVNHAAVCITMVMYRSQLEWPHTRVSADLCAAFVLFLGFNSLTGEPSHDISSFPDYFLWTDLL